MQSLFFPTTTMFQTGINTKIAFNKHFARKYIMAYTIHASCQSLPLYIFHKKR